MSGDSRFKEQLDAMWELHCQKADGYGREDDAFANIHAVSRLGVKPSQGVFIRLQDKWERLVNLLNGAEDRGEGIDDTLRDIAAYAVIARIMLEEENAAPRLPFLVIT